MSAALATHELAARGIIMVQEGRGLFANMSVRENLVLGAYTLGNAARRDRAPPRARCSRCSRA